MFEDLTDLENDANLETDICVVGAGAAGLAIVREFLRSQARVLVVESGGLQREDEIDALNAGENVGVRDESIDRGRARGLGGTTQVWPGGCLPLVDIDLQERSWVPHSGWPVTRDQLSLYYERARELLAVPAYSFSDDVWRVIGTRALDVDPQLLSHAVIAFSPRPYRFPGRMLRKDLERSQRIRALLHATATELRLDPSRTAVEKLEVKTLAGSRAIVRAKTFVLCGGGIENARLLLASRLDRPEGVGNRYDLVGRYY